MRCLIYGLVDPRDGHLRYIGKSCSGLERPRRHGSKTALLADDTHKARWIKQLQSDGLNYEIVVLQHVDREVLAQAERFWISYFRQMGCSLTNLTDGGDGNLGGKRSAATRAKIADANRRRQVSDETRAKMAEAKKGRIPHNLSAVHAATRGKKQDPEFVRRRIEARMRTLHARRQAV